MRILPLGTFGILLLVLTLPVDSLSTTDFPHAAIDPSACLLRVVRVELKGKSATGLVVENKGQEDRFLELPASLLGKDGNAYLNDTFASLACAWLAKEKKKNLVSFEGLRILAPISQPKNVVAVGLNYADHNKEVDKNQLVLFSKRTDISAATAPIIRPNGSLLDWEVELTVVIRKEITQSVKLTPTNYREYIAGFVVANDVSNRIPIIEDTEKGFSRGKTAHTFLPLGPYFVPSESLPISSKGIPELEMHLKVNGELKQKAKTTDMSNSLYDLLVKIMEQRSELWVDARGQSAKLLLDDKLVPGDIILTGTPGGTALQVPALGGKLGLGLRALTEVRNPKSIFIEKEYCSGRYLRDGDIVEAEIQFLGKQRNKVLESFSKEIPVRCRRKGEVESFLNTNKRST